MNVHALASEKIVGDLSGGKGEEQEEKGADKFANEGDEEMTGPVGKPSETRHTLLTRSGGIDGIPGRDSWLNHGALDAGRGDMRRS